MFEPVEAELTETELKVTGSIPDDLNGRYFRNGSNPVERESRHWFLGHGMIHGLRLEGGQARWYRNRYVKTPFYNEGHTDYVASLGDLTMSLANTHVIEHAGRILALEELHLPFEVDAELQTIGAYDFGGKLTTNMTGTSEDLWRNR